MLTSLRITEPPAQRPLSLDEAKLHLRLDGDDEDELVLALIDAAAELLGESSGRAWILAGYEATFDGWTADGVLRLPRAPLVAVASIALRGEDGEPIGLDPSSYRALPGTDLVVRTPGADWSLDGLPPAPDRIVVGFAAGYGETSDEVPPRVKAALKLTLTHLFEHRGDDDAAELPPAIDALIAGVRGARYGGE